VTAEPAAVRWTVGTARRVDARGVACGVPWLRAWVDHGLRDEYGRRVGGYASIVDLTAIEVDPERRFEVRVQVTRDQTPFGASRGVYRYGSIELAQREALLKLAQQRVRQLTARGGRPAMTRAAAQDEAHRRWGTAGSAAGDRRGMILLRPLGILLRCEVGFRVHGDPGVAVERFVVARGETWAGAFARADRVEAAVVARCLDAELGRDGGPGIATLARTLDSDPDPDPAIGPLLRGRLLKTLLDRGAIAWREGEGYRATDAGRALVDAELSKGRSAGGAP